MAGSSSLATLEDTNAGVSEQAVDMMVTTEQRPAREQRPWFSTWFDSSHYHRLYGDRDEAEATRFIDAHVARLRPARDAGIADLGCGAGRHAKYLASQGFRVTGLDLAAFDHVFNFFTSFGYFDTFNEHLAFVWNMAHALKAGGEVVMDYLNVGYAEARLTPREVKTIDGVTYCITRWADARLEDVHGDYQLGPYDALESSRMIVMARKGRSVTKPWIRYDSCCAGSHELFPLAEEAGNRNLGADVAGCRGLRRRPPGNSNDPGGPLDQPRP